MQAAPSSSRLAYQQLRRNLKLLTNARTPAFRFQATNVTDASFAAAMDPTVPARKPVVTAIIRRDSDGKLLLVKRSDQVGSYQQYWGGVSGGVEGNESLLHRALQEISEEVGLSPQQLQLVTCGRPLAVDDGRRHFLIFPFLFNLLDPSAPVTLNWENVAFDWVAASAVPHLQHVPLLPETVRRLLLPPYMATHVAYLKADRQHGAAELAAYVLQAVRTVMAYEERSAHPPHTPSSRSAPAGANSSASNQVQQQQQSQPQPSPPPQQQQQPHEATFDHWMEAYRNLCFHMAVVRPSMAAVANTAADVMLQLQRELAARADPFEPTAGVARVALTDAVDKLSTAMQQRQAATINNTAAVLSGGMRVMTTSLSSTVAKAIIQAHKQALNPTGGAAAGHTPAAVSGKAGPAAAAAGDGGVSSSSGPAVPQTQHQGSAGAPQGSAQVDWGSADWVDDPNFWPSSSGVGREQPGNAGGILPPFLNGSGSTSSFKGSSKGPGPSVIVCESRPLCEGVTMAQRLAAAGLSVTVITDAQAGVFMDEVDLVLLGADAVTPAGVVNKVGSRLLALAAKAAGVPVVAVTDSLKVSPGPVTQFALPNTVLQSGEEEKAVTELLPAWGSQVAAAVEKLGPEQLQHHPQQDLQQQQEQQQEQQQAQAASAASPVSSSPTAAAAGAGAGDASTLAPGGSIELRNVYFEAVPMHLVSAVITDQGVLHKAAVAAIMEARGKGYQQAFGLDLPDDLLAG